MSQRVNADLPLLEKMQKLVPSTDNQTCECAGDYICACCVIKDALVEIERLQKLEAAFFRGDLKHV